MDDGSDGSGSGSGTPLQSRAGLHFSIACGLHWIVMACSYMVFCSMIIWEAPRLIVQGDATPCVLFLMACCGCVLWHMTRLTPLGSLHYVALGAVLSLVPGSHLFPQSLCAVTAAWIQAKRWVDMVSRAQ